MSSQATQPARPPARSPILAAAGISLAIGLGALLGTADPATVEDAVTGKWLTRPFVEAQQSQTIAIAMLEDSVGGVSRDIDFVAARVRGAIERNENQASDRFAQLESEIAALKEKIAGIQNIRFTPTPAAREPQSNDMGLRSSLNDLTAAHQRAVAALTKRLDHIEVMVGLATDTTSSVARPAAQRARRAAAVRRKRPAAVKDTATFAPARLDRGHLFDIRPPRQPGAPLHVSKLRD